MNVAELIIEILNEISIDYVFGVPGGAIEPIYNALAKKERQNGIRSVVARHETGAAFMAEGYYRKTNKLGVCCATSGPGATNLITGVANAFENNIPMLVLTGQPAISLWGKGALQESSCTGVNILSIFEKCTNYNSLISHKDQIEFKIYSAILTALKTNPGPVHLSIPVDIQREEVSRLYANNLKDKILKAIVHEDNLKDIIFDIEKTKKISLLVGAGGKKIDHELIELSKKIGAKIVLSPDAKTKKIQDSENYFGVYGFAGHDQAREAIDESDLIIILGMKLSEWTSCAWDNGLLLKNIIHIDDVVSNFIDAPIIRKQYFGDLKYVIDFISQNVENKNIKYFNENVLNLDYKKHDNEKIKPQTLMYELNKRLPDNTHFVAEPGNSSVWAIHYLNSDLEVLMNFAPMGWAIGTSVGMAMNSKDPIVCITGDGSYLMSGQEITVALQENKFVLFVILNDSALGMVKHGQRLANAERTAFELPIIDYSKMVDAMGIEGYVINKAMDLDKIDFNELIKKNRPVLLDVRIDGEEVPPMKLRIKTLNGK